MIWCMEISKIYLEELLLTKCQSILRYFIQNQRGLSSVWACIKGLQVFFNKKARDTSTHTGAGIISENQQFANELYKPITRKFQRCKV